MSKKINRIFNILNQSNLSIFDVNNSIKDDLYIQNINETISDVNKKFQEIGEILFCSGKFVHKNLFSKINENGIIELFKIIEILTKENSNKKISFRTIFGATEIMPVRAFIYLLPSIYILEEIIKFFSESNFKESLNIEFIFMNNASITINNYDKEKVENASNQFIKLAYKYIENFHPKVLDYVSFYIDDTFSSSLIKNHDFILLSSTLEKKLNKDLLLKENLINMGKNHNSKDSLAYALLHPFVHDGVILNENFKFKKIYGKEKFVPDYIVSLGSFPETHFYNIRKLIEEDLKKIKWFKITNTVQYILNITTPPYSSLLKEDLYIEDILKKPELLKEIIKKDYKTKKYCQYSIPVQKAIEELKKDTNNKFSEFLKENKKA